jgi:hypothetical protein
MQARPFYLVVSLLSGFAFSVSVFGAKIQPVYSLKNLGDQPSMTGKSYQKVEIKCNTIKDLRYIHRNDGDQVWCVNGNSSECFDERMGAATRACSVEKAMILSDAVSGSDRELTRIKNAEQLLADVERNKLEQELMAIQQKKIELRTRKLELRKRELELQSQQDSL